MIVPTKVYGQEGYDYFVPLVTKEDNQLENQSGFILNKGFVPPYKAGTVIFSLTKVLSNNARIENTRK